MSDELNRAFSTGRGGDGGDVTVWVPPIEVSYQDGNFVVQAELPGVPDEDVTVEIRDDAVVIQGEREETREENQGGIRRSELRYGRFFRAIPLPDGADPDQAQAEFTNGVLRITVPVAEARSNARQIPVQSGRQQGAQGQTAQGTTTQGQGTAGAQSPLSSPTQTQGQTGEQRRGESPSEKAA